MIIHCKYDELLNPKKLKNYGRNANKHPQSQIDRLAGLYKFHGIRHPIIVDQDRQVIAAGHGRKLAAIRAGITEFPVVFQKFETEEDLYTFCQADNAATIESELDLAKINLDIADLGPFDIDSLGIPGFGVDAADRFEDKDADEIPEEVEPQAKLGQIYQLGDHRLMCGDSTDEATVSILMNGHKADMVFTDPPYGISVVSKDGSLGAAPKGKYKQVMNDETTNVAELSFKLCERMKINMIFWGANHYSNVFPSSSCWVVWDKQGGKRVTFADCELAYTNLKKPARLFKHIWDGFRRDSEKGDMRVHPTQKPVKLIEDIFELFKEESGKTIIDLFGGSGSTLIACEKTNRKCFMMELDPHYIDVIIARWEKFTDKKAVLLNGNA